MHRHSSDQLVGEAVPRKIRWLIIFITYDIISSHERWLIVVKDDWFLELWYSTRFQVILGNLKRDFASNWSGLSMTVYSSTTSWWKPDCLLHLWYARLCSNIMTGFSHLTVHCVQGWDPRRLWTAECMCQAFLMTVTVHEAAWFF